jgi:pyruvate dehydrogenase kinase 2/3/4
MVLFGQNPSQGTLLKASQFLAGTRTRAQQGEMLRHYRRSPTEELPVRLAHRVRELDDLPQGLSDMPSIRRVKEWYAQSFEASILTGRHSCLSPRGLLICITDL